MTFQNSCCLATELATGGLLSLTLSFSSCPAPYARLPSPSTPQPFLLPISLFCQHARLCSCADATVNGVQSFILVPAWGVGMRWVCGWSQHGRLHALTPSGLRGNRAPSPGLLQVHIQPKTEKKMTILWSGCSSRIAAMNHVGTGPNHDGLSLT